MFFSVRIPGYGEVFVEATSESIAIAAVRQFLTRNGIGLEEGSSLGAPVPATRSEVAGSAVLNSSGFPVEVGLPEVPVTEQPTAPAEDGQAVSGVSSTETTPAVTSDTIRGAGGVPVFVGKVIAADGSVRYVQVESNDTNAAREAIAATFGPQATIAIVSSPQFLLEVDSEFGDLFRQSGVSSLDSFVKDLRLVEPVSTEPAGNSSGQTPEPVGGQTSSSEAANLPVDVQDFPFASFQNAVAQLGLDPEGALGSTVSQRFDALAPAAQIGSLTGTIEGIGQDPGALEQFFLDRFGDLDLAAETFRDLLAGQTANDLGADQLLAFRAFQDPDIGTTQGRGDAADVFRLARAAAADRFGPFVASRLLPSNARLFRELERRLAQGNPSTDFLQFARQQNLLPA